VLAFGVNTATTKFEVGRKHTRYMRDYSLLEIENSSGVDCREMTFDLIGGGAPSLTVSVPRSPGI